MTLEDLLRTKVQDHFEHAGDVEFVPDFRVAVQGESEDGVHFIIHPDGYDGNTLDFIAKGNEVKPMVD